VISAFVSLTLSPALSALLLRPHSHEPPRNPLSRVLGRLARGFNRGFDAMSNGYARAVRTIVGVPVLALLVYAGLLGATAWVVLQVPRGFIPMLDQGYAIVVVQLPDGSSLSRTDSVTRRATEIARDTPGALNAVAFAGFSGATFTNATNSAAIFVTFKPYSERLKDGLNATAIVGQLFGRMQQIEEAFIIAIPPRRYAAWAMPGAGRCRCRSAPAPT
jgi:HAE1 family hydrophobic/amphiphilic exporter-1